MKPHAREKRVVNKKVEVTKQPINNSETNNKSIFEVLKKVFKNEKNK